MNVLDLFSGIGGFSLGLERTGGFRTVAFCEIEPYARRVLARHWPDVPCFPDVRLLGRDLLDVFGIDRIDVVCGGFPCQDISLAGKGAGLAGERSGLFFEIVRIIRELKEAGRPPTYIVLENVSALRSRGLEAVLREIAALGYDAEWHCIPASAVGAPHRRDRVWIVAYLADPGGGRRSGPGGGEVQQPRRTEAVGGSEDVADPARIQPGRAEQRPERERIGEGGESVAVANAHHPRLQGWLGRILQERAGQLAARAGSASSIPDPDGAGRDEPIGTGEAVSGTGPSEPAGPQRSGWHQWLAEPDVGRVADGVPARVDRLRALGNAVVPQIPEIIGRAILAAEGVREAP